MIEKFLSKKRRKKICKLRKVTKIKNRKDKLQRSKRNHFFYSQVLVFCSQETEKKNRDRFNGDRVIRGLILNRPILCKKKEKVSKVTSKKKKVQMDEEYLGMD